MSITQEQIDKLKSLRAKGVTKIVLNGAVMEYDTLDAMGRAIEDFQREIDIQNGRNKGARRPGAFRARTGKGL